MHAQAQESTTQLKCLWDGLHDVAPCLQREIDEAAREGRGPIFPAGTWPLGRALVLDSNMRIDGSHRVTLIPTTNNSDSSLLLKGLNSLTFISPALHSMGRHPIRTFRSRD
jgi:polygalacturonase